MHPVRYVLFLVLFCLGSAALAQPATIDNDLITDVFGDTITGSIGRRSVYDRQFLIEFTKPVLSGDYVLERINFKPQNLKGYCLNGATVCYVSKTLTEEHLDVMPENFTGQTVFMEVIESGHFTLLSYHQSWGEKQYFFDVEGRGLIVLKRENYKEVFDRHLKYCNHDRCSATLYSFTEERFVSLFRQHNRYRKGTMGEYLCTPQNALTARPVVYWETGIRQLTSQNPAKGAARPLSFQKQIMAIQTIGGGFEIGQQRHLSFVPLLTYNYQQNPSTENETLVYQQIALHTAFIYKFSSLSKQRFYLKAGYKANLWGQLLIDNDRFAFREGAYKLGAGISQNLPRNRQLLLDFNGQWITHISELQGWQGWQAAFSAGLVW